MHKTKKHLENAMKSKQNPVKIVLAIFKSVLKFYLKGPGALRKVLTMLVTKPFSIQIPNTGTYDITIKLLKSYFTNLVSLI